MREPLVEGVALRLNGRDYVLPPMNLDVLEKYEPVFEEWRQGQTTSIVARLKQVAEILHAALTRNYPEMTLQEVKSGLDLKNFGDILNTLMESSGLVAAAPGELGAGSV